MIPVSLSFVRNRKHEETGSWGYNDIDAKQPIEQRHASFFKNDNPLFYSGEAGQK
jgi:hypothetical protein